LYSKTDFQEQFSLLDHKLGWKGVGEETVLNPIAINTDNTCYSSITCNHKIILNIKQVYNICDKVLSKTCTITDKAYKKGTTTNFPKHTNQPLNEVLFSHDLSTIQSLLNTE